MLVDLRILGLAVCKGTIEVELPFNVELYRDA